MQRDYRLFKQEKNFCVAACLQSVLDRRKIPVLSQKEISGFFPMRENGVDLSPENLKEILKRFSLGCEYFHPRKTEIDVDVLIQEAFSRDSDILTGYGFDLPCIQKGIGHASLIEDFNGFFFYLLDPQRGITTREYYDLIRAMDFDDGCGFYIIS